MDGNWALVILGMIHDETWDTDGSVVEVERPENLEMIHNGR